MFKKVLEYAGEYRRTTYASIAVMLLGVVMSVLPYFFIYRLIAPPLTGELANPGQSLLWAAAIALCGVLHALLHVKGLTDDEKEIILDGCLMNYYAKRSN